jgi:hypothetical protein
MTRERWSLLEPLIDAALDLAPDRRPAFYDEVAANDPSFARSWSASSGDPAMTMSVQPAAAERFALLLDGQRAPSLVTDVLPQLQESLGSAYTLERELGGGGMSRVFLAHEAELGRRVVIKVLTPELAAGINAERFDREIKLVASLQQANIVPLLATGRAAGYPYYTMPFVEGRSLRDRLAREGVLPISEAVNLPAGCRSRPRVRACTGCRASGHQTRERASLGWHRGRYGLRDCEGDCPLPAAIVPSATARGTSRPRTARTQDPDRHPAVHGAGQAGR